MITKIVFTLALLLGVNSMHWAQNLSNPDPEYPYVEVVVTQEHIWLMPDEKPVSEIPVQLINDSGEVVLQKTFCSKLKDWSIGITNLPSGKYKILIGNHQTEYLEKKGRKWTL
ncbi:MAG: hypothetical protein IT260_13045 [Saprospiraceae bacterium]|nr:hypothetical protein [Saprospiraceae bacterium]